MADRQRRKGIQHNFPHDQRNTRKPLNLAGSAPTSDYNCDENVSNIHSASYDDVHSNPSQRGRSTCSGYNKQYIPSPNNLRSIEVARIRDSGYNTDVSPARTSSSTSTPAEHFSFDYPERMTIRGGSIMGSPHSLSSEDHPESLIHHFQEQEQQYNDTESHFVQLQDHINQPFTPVRTSRASIMSPGTTFFPNQQYTDSLRRRSYDYNDGDDNDNNDGGFSSQRQELLKNISVLSHSAPGSQDYLYGSSVETGQTSGESVELYPGMISDDAENYDTVDGRWDDATFPHGYKKPPSSNEVLGIPLLPKSMSSSFQDLRGGDETESDEDEENDVMSSSEEREMEEMVISSNSRRFSLRKRHYSGSEDENRSSSSISSTPYRVSGTDGAANAIESDLSIQVPVPTLPPSLSCDFTQTSPELASSITNACRFMVGLNIGSSADEVEEQNNVCKRSRNKGLTQSSSANSFLREEEELFLDDSLNADTQEDTTDSFDIDEGDEDVFTFDMDDIREYQETFGREIGATSNDSRYSYEQHHVPDNHHQNINYHRSQLQQHSAPATPKAPAAVPPRIVLDRPPISPSSRTGRKTGSKPVPVRQGRCIHAHVQLAGGARLPWEESSNLGGIVSSSSTQTPHRTSLMIDEIVSTPVALPSEVRGTAFMHLRRGSVDATALLRDQPAPLPDIVPFARDRSMSAPNLHDVILRQRAQRTGRELRRLSDLFHENVVRRHSIHHEDNPHQQSSSYPRMGPSSILPEGVRALVFGPFRSRRGSSVDDASFLEEENDDS